ncbi:MAG: DUF4402 domain-containing protein [Massilia sp.]
MLAALLLAAGFAHAKQTFTTTRSLVFGRFVAGTGGTIVLTPAGARTRTGGVALVPSTVSSASFSYNDNAANKASAAVIISLPPDGNVTLTSAGGSMALTAFTSNPAPGAGVLSGGSLTFTVGATLNVGANQPTGSYTGSLPITIQYQ